MFSSKKNTSHYRLDWLSNERLLLSIFFLIFITLEVRAASLRSLWFDEVATVLVSSQPSLSAMFHAVPYDGNPPLYFLLARSSLKLPIETELAIRIPALLAFNLAVLLTYLFVRRSSRPLCASLAALYLIAGELTGFAAVDARPYSLLLCFTTLAAVSWQMAALAHQKALGMVGLAFSMAGAVMSHQYGAIYVFVPIVAAESAERVFGGRLDYEVFAALFVGAIPALFTVPVTLRTQAPLLNAFRHSRTFASRPSVGRILPLYAELISVPMMLALAAAAAIFFTLRRTQTSGAEPSAPKTSAGEWAISISLSLFVPLMIFITRFGTGHLADRYCLGTTLGFGLLIGVGTGWLARRRQRFETVLSFVLGYSLIISFLLWAYARTRQPYEGLARDPLFLRAPEGGPMVIADPLMYSPTWWYASLRTHARIHYLSDLSYASRTKDLVPEYSLKLEQGIGAPPIEDYLTFTSANREFLLYDMVGIGSLEPREWISDRLKGECWQFSLIDSEDARHLYRVVRPDRICAGTRP